MENLIDYLTALKAKLGIKSNLQFAIRLGISQTGIDKIMKGAMTPGDEACIKIAELAGDRPEVVIALAHKSKAKGETKELWSKILKAVTAATFIVLFTLPSFAQASTGLSDNPALYIMSNHKNVIITALKLAFWGPLLLWPLAE